MKYKLELVDLEKSFSNKKVLDKLNLKVIDGEFLVVLGPSGEGKSTLLRTIVGIENHGYITLIWWLECYISSIHNYFSAVQVFYSDYCPQEG